jgi:hypothetical protein
MWSVPVRALSAARFVCDARQSELLSGVVPASRLERPSPPTVSTGAGLVDALTGGLPRGGLTEIFGPASSGRTSLLLSVLAEMTARREVCALVDATDTFDPESAAAAGVELSRVLWVRCSSSTRNREIGKSGNRVIGPFANTQSKIGNQKSKSRNSLRRLEQALKATDLVLQAGGFGLVVVDLGDIPPQAARRVPLTSWFRFRRAVENTPTVLLAITQEPCAKTCASLVLRLEGKPSAVSHPPSAKECVSGHDFSRAENGGRLPDSLPTHAEILRGLNISVEVVRSRVEQKKPNRAVAANFESKTAWNF